MSGNPHDPQRAMLDSTIKIFRSQKEMADRAIRQITFEQMRIQPDPAGNNVALIMKHLAGNMRSRWTDVLTSDGEKDWRDRDGEFIDNYTSREEVERDWESGWAVLFAAIEQLKPDDLAVTITIRDEPHTMYEAIHRSISHQGYHIGQIVTLCRALAGDNWQIMTVPRGQSRQFTEKMRQAMRSKTDKP
jgi:hypothetical protein